MAKKAPEIYCRKGNLLGELNVRCLDSFEAVAVTGKQSNGVSAERAHEAATHLIHGLEHLIVTHDLTLRDAHKAATAGVSAKLGIGAAAMREVQSIVVAHWKRGEELSNMLMGRSV